MTQAKPLPIDAVIPELHAAFKRKRNIVLSADPGAGKTTRVPLALIDEPWLNGKKIIMLEPRRLAATRSASFMAQQIGERVGETIGYRIRGETRVGKSTRIEIVTEGILTRFLQHDPSLADAGLVIFDEFHERSIHADLGLALTLDVQENLRNDLRILVMSATLDGVAIGSLLGDSEIVKSEGRSFPVETIYLKQQHNEYIEPLVAATVARALRENSGDILVFLPGQREIRRVDSILREKKLPEDAEVHLLFGDASPALQQKALAAGVNGKRKVILSTSIAETSLTIDGVSVVIDSGLSRVPKFDPRRGMSGLVTFPVSQASADQRRGRAGRQQPGVCYRLWTERHHPQLHKFSQPEILSTDLAPLALELALWATPNGEGLRFLDPPPTPHLSQSITLLKELGAVDSKGGKLTNHGKAMSELGIHPRFAHMLIRGKELRIGALACDVAALLEEHDLLRGDADAEIDLHSRWVALHGKRVKDSFARDRALAQSSRLMDLLGVLNKNKSGEKLGVLLGLAYPERIAKRREEESLKYQFAGGTGGILPKGSTLSKEEYLAVADVDGAGSEVKIFLAEPISEKEIFENFAELLNDEEEIRWDDRLEMVIARRMKKLGNIIISETAINTDSDAVRSAMIDGIRRMGFDLLPWTNHATSLMVRSEWLRKQNLNKLDLPNLERDHLMNTIHEWLPPYLGGITRKSHLSKLDTSQIIDSFFSYQQRRELDILAPTHITIKNNKRIALEYQIGSTPVLAVRLQDMLGEKTTPTVCGGKVKVLIHLLSPARRPIAITQDLPSFWKNAYPEVRKQMRGRYPKHNWPEDPVNG
ncbi:MAG: ATP-dependent helicase HrpB [Ignavibacteriales bacterium]|nr:ATP-dependent helicase HrpB [Ignavibacteriales bacterium]